ncbi:MAG: JAB domain-containing protein [Candidatus Dormibacteria bacterium]
MAVLPSAPFSGRTPRRRSTLLPLVDRSLASRSEAELIAHVLAGPEPGRDALSCAARLARIPAWERRAMGAEGLVSGYGVAAGTAVRLAALWELAERGHADDRPSINSPRDALLLLEGIRLAGREQVAVIMLDARHRPLATEVVAVGTLNASRLLPRDVLGPPLRADAAAVIVGHNHPSGDPAPSRADRIVTAALRSAGQLVGIPVLDHLIVARLGHHSFREAEGWDGTASVDREP